MGCVIQAERSRGLNSQPRPDVPARSLWELVLKQREGP